MGVRGQKIYVNLILKKSLMWFQCFLRNVKIQLCFDDMTNSIFGGADFYIENRRVIFVDFFTFSAYKVFNNEVESTKSVSKMETMIRITKKILKMKNFDQNWAHFDKKCPFLQNCYSIQNHIL